MGNPACMKSFGLLSVRMTGDMRMKELANQLTQLYQTSSIKTVSLHVRVCG